MKACQHTNHTELGSFLGLCGYYRRFIQRVADMTSAQFEKIFQKPTWKRTDKIEEASNGLKGHFTSTPMLAFHYFETPLIVKTGRSLCSVRSFVCS